MTRKHANLMKLLLLLSAAIISPSEKEVDSEQNLGKKRAEKKILS